MSDEDRERWNQRFAQGAYSERVHPSTLLRDWMPDSGGRALDVAAGAGRNAAYLAENGFAVTALDISNVGLRRAAARTPELKTIAHDLDAGLPPALGGFDLIVVVRYLNLALMPQLISLLNTGGMLVAEVLGRGAGAGPSGGRFRAEPGALAAACGGLETLHRFEGDVVDPDGRTATVAQFVGRRVAAAVV